MRSPAFLLGSGLLLVVLAGCLAPAPRTRVVFIPKIVGSTNTFWESVLLGAQSAAEDLNVDLVVRGMGDETQVDEQIRIVERSLDEHPAALVLAAADYLRLVPAVKKARAAGIPVVTVDSTIATDDASAKVGTDNRQLGRILGAAVAKAVPPGSVVGILSYIRTSSTARDREQGLVEALKSQYLLLPTLYNEADEQTAYRQTRDLLTSRPDISALAALNLPSTLGSMRALRDSNRRGSVVLVGVDASFEVLKGLESGMLRAVLVQQPFNMGYLSVEAAASVARGRPWSGTTDTGTIEITKETLFLPQNEKLLFPVSVLNSPHSVPNP